MHCSCFMRHAVLLPKVFSQAGLIVRSTRSQTSRNRLAKLVSLKCNRLTSSISYWAQLMVQSWILLRMYTSQYSNKLTLMVCWLTTAVCTAYTRSFDAFDINVPGEPKKIPPTTFVDITAMHENFCTKFYTIVKRSNIHFITKFYWNISGIDKATQF